MSEKLPCTAHLGGSLRDSARLDGREAERGHLHDAVVAQLALCHHYAVLCGHHALSVRDAGHGCQV